MWSKLDFLARDSHGNVTLYDNKALHKTLSIPASYNVVKDTLGHIHMGYIASRITPKFPPRLNTVISNHAKIAPTPTPPAPSAPSPPPKKP